MIINGIKKKTLNLNFTHNGTPLQKKDQGRYWESEIPDDKIIAVMPKDYSFVKVSYMDNNGETQVVICDKIALL